MLEVATRLEVSAHRLYKWIKPVAPSKDEMRSARLVKAKDEIARRGQNLSTELEGTSPCRRHARDVLLPRRVGLLPDAPPWPADTNLPFAFRQVAQRISALRGTPFVGREGLSDCSPV